MLRVHLTRGDCIHRQVIRFDATFDINKGTIASVGGSRVKLSSCVITVTGANLKLY